jgi:DNA-binding transcriptional LysR family regulator
MMRQRGSPIELVDLRYFVALADSRNFGHAATSVGVNISTISRHIGRLEDGLGLSLFERGRSGVRLTAGGRAYLLYIRRALSDIETARDLARLSAAAESGEIRLGVLTPPIGSSLVSLLDAWRCSYPNVRLTIREHHHHGLIVALTERRLDAAVLYDNTLSPSIVATPLFREKLVAAVPTDHRLSTFEDIRWADIAAEIVMIQGWDDGQGLREVISSHLGVDAIFHQNAASSLTLLSLVASRQGITLVLEGLATLNIAGVTFRAINEPNATVAINLVWSPDTEDPVVGRFVAFMRDEARSRGYV